MSDSSAPHFPKSTFAEYAQGNLRGSELERFELHLRDCAPCALEVKRVQSERAKPDERAERHKRPPELEVPATRADHVRWLGVAGVAVACALALAAPEQALQFLFLAMILAAAIYYRLTALALPGPRGPMGMTTTDGLLAGASALYLGSWISGSPAGWLLSASYLVFLGWLFLRLNRRIAMALSSLRTEGDDRRSAGVS